MNPFLCRRALPVVFLALPFSLFAVSTYAQTPAAKPAVPDAGVRFQKYLNTYAAQNHWAIVAEGAPLSLDESFTDSAKFSRATPDAQLKIIADAADYDAKHEDGSPVWVLNKRYSSPRDMPCVTIAECAVSLQKIAGLTASLVPEGSNSTKESRAMMENLYSALTPAQREMMQGQPPEVKPPAPKPISIADIPAQKRAVQLSAALLYVGSFYDYIQSTAKILSSVPKARITFNPYEPADAPRHLFWATSLKDPKAGVGMGGIGFSPVSNEGLTLPPAAPTTLAQEMARIRAAPQAEKQLPCEVDPALADKLLTVAGMENTDTVGQLKALATVYDLRLRTTDTGRIIGFRPDWKTPVTLFNVREAVAHALPAPYRRVLVGPISEEAVPKANVLSGFDVSDQKREVLNDTSRRAEKLLHLALDAPIKAAGEAGVPVASISPNVQPALVASILTKWFPYLANVMNNDVPAIVAHMDELYVLIRKTSYHEDVPQLQMTLYLKNPDGSFGAGGGVAIPVTDPMKKP